MKRLLLSLVLIIIFLPLKSQELFEIINQIPEIGIYNQNGLKEGLWIENLDLDSGYRIGIYHESKLTGLVIMLSKDLEFISDFIIRGNDTLYLYNRLSKKHFNHLSDTFSGKFCYLMPTMVEVYDSLQSWNCGALGGTSLFLFYKDCTSKVTLHFEFSWKNELTIYRIDSTGKINGDYFYFKNGRLFLSSTFAQGWLDGLTIYRINNRRKVELEYSHGILQTPMKRIRNIYDYGIFSNTSYLPSKFILLKKDYFNGCFGVNAEFENPLLDCQKNDK